MQSTPLPAPQSGPNQAPILRKLLVKRSDAPAPGPRIKHYREKDFIIVSRDVLRDARLTATDKVMLLALSSFAIGKSTVWPSRETLAALAGIDVSNVSKRIRRLEKLGWVSVTRRGTKSNMYHLCLPEAVQEAETLEPAPAKKVPLDVEFEMLTAADEEAEAEARRFVFGD